MAKVPRFEELEQGHFPQKEHFALVKARVYNLFKSSIALKWAGFYGSSVRDDFDVWSDIDVAVLFLIDYAHEARSVMQEAQAYASSFHVDLNIKPLDTQTAATRYHTWSPTFVRFLQISADNGGLIKGELEGISPTIPIADELGIYLANMLSDLEQYACEMGGEMISERFGDKRFRFLKKALNAPVDIARKMLIYRKVLRGESREDVVATYEAEAPPHLVTAILELVKIEKRFKEALKQQIQAPDKNKYHEHLLDLQVQLLRVSSFVRENILWFHMTRR